MTEHSQTENIPIIFYDGNCGFCHQSVQFILKRDRSKIFHFAPLQGKTAEACLPRHLREDTDSLILLNEEGHFIESTGALKILCSLGNIYALAGVFLWVPSSIRDFFYKWIARNRYRWFPRVSCLVPSTDETNRFLL